MPKRKLHWVSESGTRAQAEGSKAAYVSHELLPELSRTEEVIVYSPDADLPLAIKKTCQCLPLVEFRQPQSGEAIVYQLEDRPSALELLPVVERTPGIVWFHDWYLRNDAADVASFQGISQRARACAFSSVRNAFEFQRSKGKGASVLPYPCSEGSFVSANAKRSIAFCGSPLVEDHFHLLLKALQNVSPESSVRWMLGPQEVADAKKLLREFPQSQVKLVSGRTSANWATVLAESNCAVHLRFSAYGDFGPFLGQSLLSGIPVLLTCFGDAAEIDEDSVIFIEVGEREQEQLEAALSKAASAADVGAKGRKWALDVYPQQLVAAELLSLIESVSIGSHLA